jgi:hypothetical protein
MLKDHQATDTSVPAPQQDIFCRDCVFYAPPPLRFEHRCRHPRAVQDVKTYERLVQHFAEPEERNAHNDCADFEARTWWALRQDAALLLGLAFLIGVCLAFLGGLVALPHGLTPWVAVMVMGALVLLVTRFGGLVTWRVERATRCKKSLVGARKVEHDGRS